jgi:hypothetical protein
MTFGTILHIYVASEGAYTVPAGAKIIQAKHSQLLQASLYLTGCFPSSPPDRVQLQLPPAAIGIKAIGGVGSSAVFPNNGPGPKCVYGTGLDVQHVSGIHVDQVQQLLGALRIYTALELVAGGTLFQAKISTSICTSSGRAFGPEYSPKSEIILGCVADSGSTSHLRRDGCFAGDEFSRNRCRGTRRAYQCRPCVHRLHVCGGDRVASLSNPVWTYRTERGTAVPNQTARS